MEWKPIAKDGNLARQIIRDVKAERDTIKTIVSPDNKTCVVASWIDTPRRWHYYWCQDNRWQLVGTHTTATAARRAAEVALVAQEVEAQDVSQNPIPDGIATVTAKFTPGRPIVVPCSSPRTTEVISEVFRRLGARVTVRAA